VFTEREEIEIGGVKTAREGGNKSSIARLKRTSRQGGQKKKKKVAEVTQCVYALLITWVIFVHATTTFQWGSLLQGSSEKNYGKDLLVMWHEQELELVHAGVFFYPSSFFLFLFTFSFYIFRPSKLSIMSYLSFFLSFSDYRYQTLQCIPETYYMLNSCYHRPI